MARSGIGLLLSLRCGACLRAPAAPTPALSTAPATVRMLLVNDVYVSDTLRDGTGGLARVAALRDSIERATNARVLFMLAGDVLSPSVLGKWYGGAQMVDGFNAARLDLATLGNHEFDNPRANLVARLGESRFQWLSGNCGEANGAPFPGVKGWDTLRVGTVKVGILGTTVVRDYAPWVRCRNADSATTALTDTLVAQGAELIVALTHRFIFEDAVTLATEPRIQAILGGHEHDGQRVVRDGRLLVKAVSNARTAVLVTFTREGSGATARWRVADQRFALTRGMREDPATLASVQRWRDTLTRRIGPDRVLGIAPEPINAIDSVSKRESRFGNMITDGMRAGTGADVALINSGALRFDDMMAAGPITRHLLEAVFLFADETRAVTFPLTGARLRELLETGVRQGALGGGAYPQVSGVHFRIDARRPSGSRVVGDLTRDDGRVIAPGETLRVTFVTYPACRSGDGYRIPEASAACEQIARQPSSAPRTVDLVVQHLERMNGRIVAPPLGRVTRLDR
ncbi:MAG: bifunctional metallophosphatase/5'-nucleotidase [Gemmatimonas sp.]|uniref:bifunctional metallophosphatase/5'-nucleotidase n=1 Tax=Gemmatimonas sp. TaxID=1962908 RepID=UPI00391F4F44